MAGKAHIKWLMMCPKIGYHFKKYRPLFISLAVFVATVAIVSVNVYAFPSATVGNESLFQEIAKSAPVLPSKAVVLYDNLYYLERKQADAPPIFDKGCMFLVPVDIVSINLDLTYLFHAPVKLTTRDMLGDLIYANIELKKMLDKYKKIQQQAVEIAELANSPEFVNSPYVVYMPSLEQFLNNIIEKQRVIITSKNNDAGGVNGQKKSLGKEIKLAENFLNRSLSASRIVADGQKPAESESIIPNEQDDNAPNGGMPSIGSIVPPEKFANIVARSAVRAQQGAPSISFTHNNSLGYDDQPGSTKKNLEKDMQPVSSGELPWWIKTPSEFVNYCMQNKLEAGVMLLFFIFLMNGIGAIFRR